MLLQSNYIAMALGLIVKT